MVKTNLERNHMTRRVFSAFLACVMFTVSIFSQNGCTRLPRYAAEENSPTTEEVVAVIVLGIGLFYLMDMSNSSSEEGESEFFFCNYWLDDNQNGVVSEGEFKDIKKIFRAHEKITLVAKTRERKGFKLRLKLWSGKGKLIHDHSSTIVGDNRYSWKTFEPWELHKKGGEGECTAEWYLNDNLVATKILSLIG